MHIRLYNRLDQIANGYRASQILFTANRLGLFAALAKGARSAAQLAEALSADLRATRILCDALAALRLLRKRGNTYANSSLAREFLLPERPRSQNALFLHGAALYERWGRLYDVVKTGEPVPRQAVEPRLRGDERAFAHAMASSASLGARETAAKLGLAGVRTLLDIGGGPGLYAIAFARRNPRLKAVVFDNAPTLRVAQANIAKAGLAERIQTRAGDALRDDLGAGYDLVLLSNVVHSYSAADNQQLITKAAQALAPCGRLAVKDFLLTPSRTKPQKASLFAVNMLVSTTGGDCYTVAEIKHWLRQAGLAVAHVVKLTPPAQVVVGRRWDPPGARAQ